MMIDLALAPALAGKSPDRMAGSYFQERIEELAKEAWEQADSASVPDDLMRQLQGKLTDDPTIPWWEAIKGIVSEETEPAEEDVP